MKKIKITKFTIIFFLILLLSFANTLKGVVMVKCGYGLEYWLVEILSLLIGSGLLYLIWKLDDLSHCSTVVNDRVKK
jgi:hypothetical protein